jgi:hypothetical protein
MAEYNWIKRYSETKPKFTEIRVNNMYPYTFEQTIRVTHHSKPKRRDASRNWRNK